MLYLTIQRIALQMFKFTNNLLPSAISELFISNSAVYEYNTRTRCTRGDARSFFCTHKTYLYAQNKILYEYIQILF